MRILVVEDQKKSAAFIKKGLSAHGYSVDTTESGTSAELLCAENEYDLVILDVMLIDQNGFDTSRAMRRDGYSGPILMLSALSGTRDKVHGLDAGADDYLTKPFEFDELLARVRALLRRGKPGSQLATLSYSDLKMDLVRRSVTRNTLPLSLTPKEFSLLEYFLRNPERPISRAELGEKIWDINFDHESNVIDVYVNALRKKLDLGQATPKLIHTIIGVGYALKTDPSTS